MNNPKKRILVVDDEPSITRLLKLNLEHTNAYEVMTENSSEQALETARVFQPDLILLDVLMPGLDGGYLASRFQENPRFKDIPIIFLTAAVTKREVAEHHGKIGDLPFLAKPVNMTEVIRCLESHFRPQAAAA